MYNPKKKLPRLEEEVLVAVKEIGGIRIHEGMVDSYGKWYLYKYDRWHGEVVGWMYKPMVNDFTWRFLAFSLGFAVGVVFVYLVAMLMGG